MFNGIIKNTGVINKISKNNKNCVIQVFSKMNISKNEIGSSISCSGACLTIESFKKNLIQFYLSKETLSKTNFNSIKVGDININTRYPMQGWSKVKTFLKENFSLDD